MDPLSVLASVAGLLMAAGSVSSTLITIRSSLKDAPQSVSQVASEKFLSGLAAAPRHRIALIQLDQLVAILTEAVLTFSELEALVTPFMASSTMLTMQRMKWLLKDDEVTPILHRLQRHKSSLSLMLNIVQCESDLEADKSRETLQNLFQQLLESNQDISRRLGNLENMRESGSILTQCFRNKSCPDIAEEDGEDAATITLDRQVFDRFNFTELGLQLGPFRHAFEDDLETSRVYNRTQIYEVDVDFASSAVRTHAWSIFSGLSLAQISVISAIALPLYSHDIVNNQWYRFGELNQTESQRAVSAVDSPNTTNTDVADWQANPALPKMGHGTRLRMSQKPVKQMTLYKLVIMGDGDSRKTALTIQLCLLDFIETYDATIDYSYRKQATIDGEFCMLEVLNTALRDQRARDGEGFLIVYSITSRPSFTRVRRFYDQIQRVKDSQGYFNPLYWGDPPYTKFPVMIVGNNSDRITEREVSTQEGIELAKELGCEFVEASAKNCINVEKAFYDVVRLIRKRKSRPLATFYEPRAHVPRRDWTGAKATSQTVRSRRRLFPLR